MGTEWTFRCYVSTRGVDEIDAWYQEQPDKLQAKFDTRLRYLRQQPRVSWVRPYFGMLSGECDGLGEIRFEWNKVQYRPVGFVSADMEFTLLIVSEEHGGQFIPRKTCEIAQRRRAEILANREHAHDCLFE